VGYGKSDYPATSAVCFWIFCDFMPFRQSKEI